jgi:hypothetical protein
MWKTLTLSDVDSAQKGGSNDVKRGLHDDGPNNNNSIIPSPNNNNNKK